MSTSFDVIVVGVGSMGSSACYHLAQRGYKILGLEQFGISHEYGSHAGQSRIIRKAYFENSDYVPLLNRAYENWKVLEEETGQQIYVKTGLVYFGNPDRLLIQGVKQSASLYQIPLESIGASRAQEFPHFKIPAGFDVLWEPDAGFVTPEKAIQLYAQQAIKKGAELRTGEKVLEWKKDEHGIIVRTDKNAYRCSKLVITAGAWAREAIPSLAEKIRITRQFVVWIKPTKWENFTLGNFPCWLLADETKPGCYYGFPILPEDFGSPIGLKIAHHHPGLETDPDNVDRRINKTDEEDLKYVLDKYLPGVFESIISHKICLYANSPDEDFIVDNLPGSEDHVAIACGFSGHGFKFASAIGEILADLATDGKTRMPIGFLSARRFSL